MTRRAQPHRKGSPARRPGPALDAMRRGAAANGVNPAKAKNGIRALLAKKRRRKHTMATARKGY